MRVHARSVVGRPASAYALALLADTCGPVTAATDDRDTIAIDVRVPAALSPAARSRLAIALTNSCLYTVGLRGWIAQEADGPPSRDAPM